MLGLRSDTKESRLQLKKDRNVGKNNNNNNVNVSLKCATLAKGACFFCK